MGGRDSEWFTGNLGRAVSELQMKSDLCWASGLEECSSLFLKLTEETIYCCFTTKLVLQNFRNHLLLQQMYLNHRPEMGTFVLTEY